ncbi:unnamed protein product [Amoebophrya sp. A25]|nr:unnamed protein product [Amoebophrya sp. A25]|eukprot:GSA25T00006347001.1
MNGHGHDWIHPDRATYRHMTRTSSVVVWGLNITIYSNMIQYLWAKGRVSNPREQNRFRGPCLLLALALCLILVENTQALGYVIGFEMAPRYERVTNADGSVGTYRTCAYWTVLFTTWCGMLSACIAFVWYYRLQRYFLARDRLFACDTGSKADDCGPAG